MLESPELSGEPRVEGPELDGTLGVLHQLSAALDDLEAGDAWPDELRELVDAAAGHVRRTLEALSGADAGPGDSATDPGDAAEASEDTSDSSGAAARPPPPPAEDAPPSGGVRPRRVRPRGVLNGDSASIAIPDVLGFLSGMRKSGTLTIRAAAETFTLELREGNVVYAHGDNPPRGLRLGEILLSQGALTEEVLRPFLVSQKERSGSLGVRLLAQGAVSEDALRIALAFQAQHVIHRIYATTNATFEFHEGVHLAESEDIRLNVTQLLLESARSMDEREKQVDDALAWLDDEDGPLGGLDDVLDGALGEEAPAGAESADAADGEAAIGPDGADDDADDAADDAADDCADDCAEEPAGERADPPEGSSEPLAAETAEGGTQADAEDSESADGESASEGSHSEDCGSGDCGSGDCGSGDATSDASREREAG